MMFIRGHRSPELWRRGLQILELLILADTNQLLFESFETELNFLSSSANFLCIEYLLQRVHSVLRSAKRSEVSRQGSFEICSIKNSSVMGFAPVVTTPQPFAPSRLCLIPQIDTLETLLAQTDHSFFAVAGSVAFQHCSDNDPETRPLLLVTASVDRIRLARHIRMDVDLAVTGKVTWVGRSSMEIQIRLDQPTASVEQPGETSSALRFSN